MIINPIVYGNDAELDEETFTANGTYTATDYKLDGFSKVTVSIPLQNTKYLASGEMDFTEYGDYQYIKPNTGYTAMKKVMLYKPTNLLAGNIKANVTIAGVTGSYTGKTPTGTLTITVNGIYAVTDYALVDVDIPKPTAELSISTNGDYDVTDYATAHVAVQASDENLKALIERSITTCAIPDGTERVGVYSFRECTELTTVTIPDSVTSIDNYAFEDCTALTTVTFGSGSTLTKIDAYAFEGCTALTSITIPDSVTYIGINAFDGCHSLASVNIPDGVTSISSYTFRGCYALTSITIPDSVTTIRAAAFYNCNALASVIIGGGATSISGNAFYHCYALTSITCKATTPPTIQSSTFDGVPSKCIIYVPSASVDTYKAASVWSDRADYIQAIS